MLADIFNRERDYPNYQIVHCPMQIKNIKQLHMESFYRFFSFSLVNSTLVIGARFKLINLGSETAEIIIDDFKRKAERFELDLSYLGIIPYPDGTWNPTNYLVPAD